MPELSILIPARNEQFLKHTVEDILKNSTSDTEVIVVSDGDWPIGGLESSSRVKLIKTGKPVGQRAATNMAAKLSTAKYVMKLDAHCAFDYGFDTKMLEMFQELGDDITAVPVMRNLHVFDWVCALCGRRWYQGPTPTKCESENCTSSSFTREMVWKGKESPQSTAYRFNRELEFKYWGEYKTKQVGDYVETLSLQGSCFMLTREKYWELDICDESWGSWGGQGAEVALKTWLSGGRVICNKKTWYAHLFRTQGGDFGFPYPNPGNEQKKAKDTLRSTFLNDKWPKAKHTLQWLLDRFSPVPDWHTVDAEKQRRRKPSKGVVYYTDNEVDDTIATAVRKQITKGIKEKHIVSVSLKPIEFGHNITLPLTRGYITMTKQILTGLEALESDIVYFCEHDVLYHPSHFALIPEKPDTYYYNTNVWQIRAEDGHALWTDDLTKLSQLVAYRDILIEHYTKRLKVLEETLANDPNNFSRTVRRIGFEPGTHNRAERIDTRGFGTYQSAFPNLDIRHDNNLTPSRWRPEQYRNQKYTKGWTEADEVPGWGKYSEVITI